MSRISFIVEGVAKHRPRIDEVVKDPAVAEILKPYYRYLCKRPCFHDEFLEAFNEPNVTLVDCPGGIERFTAAGPVVEGQQYEAPPGSLIFFPRGVPHRNWNAGSVPTVHLAFNTPQPDPAVPFALPA